MQEESLTQKQPDVSKSQLTKIKERFGKLTEQLRRTTMLLKKREKLFYDLEDKFSSMEHEVELEKEKNTKLEQQFKESMEGTLDVEALKNYTVLNAQVETLKKELSNSQQSISKIKADTASKIKALQQGLQEEMSKAAHAKSEIEAQLYQLQEERVRYANYQEDSVRMEKQLAEFKASNTSLVEELAKAKEQIIQKEKHIEDEQTKFSLHLKEDEQLAEKVGEEIKALKAEVTRLDEICRVFDVIALENDSLALRGLVGKVVRKPDQKQLLLTLDDVELMKNRIDAFEKMTADRVANFYNAALEMEAMLKNNIPMEE